MPLVCLPRNLPLTTLPWYLRSRVFSLRITSCPIKENIYFCHQYLLSKNVFYKIPFKYSQIDQSLSLLSMVMGKDLGQLSITMSCCFYFCTSSDHSSVPLIIHPNSVWHHSCLLLGEIFSMFFLLLIQNTHWHYSLIQIYTYLIFHTLCKHPLNVNYNSHINWVCVCDIWSLLRKFLRLITALTHQACYHWI